MASIVRKVILLSHDQLDVDKWNRCVSRNHGLIYNLFGYIDTLSENWHAIVVGDYDCIFPIPWKKKWGIRYVPKVPFIQQLTLLGICSDEEFRKIVQKIFSFVSYGDLFLSNKINLGVNDPINRTNYYLDLQNSHEYIYDNYKPNLKKGIRKAKKYNLIFSRSDIKNTFETIFFHYLSTIRNFEKNNFERLSRWMSFFQKNECLHAFVVRNESENLAMALFLFYDNRLYNIMPCTFDIGRKMSAMHFLLDQVINLYANSNVIFDFEGSEITGVKDFYEQFSPMKEVYFQYHINRLPFPINRIKK